MAEPRKGYGAWTWRRKVVAGVLLVLGLAAAWGAAVRITAPRRSLAVYGETVRTAADSGAPAMGPRGSPAGTEPSPANPGSGPAGPRADTIRLLTWNIAHGRGDRPQGPLENFRGGDAGVRAIRLDAIARVIRSVHADVVVLNEVDFQAAWSGEVDQAAVLARAAGYPAWVEQRNFDFSLLLADFAFGNALLSRLPVRDVRAAHLPPHSRLEVALVGAKSAAVAELATAAGPVAVVPIHLEFRDEATRLAAVPVLTALRDHAPPLLLAGDFNTAPPGWPGADSATAVGRLLDAGWTSARAASGGAGEGRPTFPSTDPRRAIDWVLAEPPLRVLDAQVLTSHPELSDHLPVLATVEVPGP